jgi:DNA-binding XRE family transcriptional regulator
MNNKIIKKDLKDYVQTEPLQLRLFDLSKQNSDKYSNTIEMYDSMPKYHLGGVEREKGKTTEALPVISRDFVYRKKGFKINISPAAIVDKKSGKTISYYPSQREELVEDVIRKIAANKRKRGIYLDEDMAVRFTYYEIEQELLKIGHGYSKAEIKQSIEVCSKTIIEITSKDGNQVSQTSPLFPFVAKESKEMGGQERVIVMFHPLVTKSVDSGTYRTINYDRLMKLKMYLARWLHKHISHVFTQATEKNPYKIKLSTIVTNSGMKSYEKISHTVIQVKKALDELVKCQTVASYEVEFHKEKNKILDVTFLLFMSEEFVADVKKGNALSTQRLSDDEFGEYDESVYAVNFDELRKEMSKEIYELKEIYINNVIAKIRSKEDAETALLALEAAENYIKITPNCIPVAIVKSAIREGWTPKNKKVEIEEKIEKSVQEIQDDLFKIQKKEEVRVALQKTPEWLQIRKEIKKTFDEQNWEKWLSSIELSSFEESNIVLMAPTKFIRDWIAREMLDKTMENKNLLHEVIQKVCPKIQKVTIISPKV